MVYYQQISSCIGFAARRKRQIPFKKKESRGTIANRTAVANRWLRVDGDSELSTYQIIFA